MKKIVNLTLTRYLTILSAVIAGTLCIISLAGILLASAVNIYDNSLDTVIGNGQKNLLGLYSRYIFESMQNDNTKVMEDSNMEYIILRGINPHKDIDGTFNISIASDKKNIVYSNNSSYLSGLSENDIHQFTSSKIFSKDEGLYYQPVTLLKSFFDDGFQHSSFSSYKSYTEYVERVFFNDGVFYFETEKYAFPVKTIELPASSISNKDYKMIKNHGYSLNKKDIMTFKLETSNQGKHFYRSTEYNIILNTDKYNTWEKFSLNDIYFLPKNVAKGNISEGKKFFNYDKDYECYIDFNDELENTAEYKLEYLNISISYKINDDSYSNIYVVLSKANPTIVNDKDDLFATQKNIITSLYRARYIMIVVSILSAVVFLIMLILSCHSKYLSSDNDIVRKNIVHRMPFLVYASIIGGILAVDIGFGIVMFAETAASIVNTGSMILELILATLWIMSCIYLFILILLEISCRVGAQILLKSTLIYMAYKIVKKICDYVKKIFNKINNNISLFAKTITTLIIANAFLMLHLLFITQMYFNFNNGICLFFALIDMSICAAFDLFVLKIVFQMEALQKHAKKMANGNLESKVDTSKMINSFKKHGEYLNKIGEGMSVAVNERIKSEHFKTELITNVSHDIKTPLTSIINYVDLLKKENIQEPKVQEYIEILERQSARLKKLIEDLMEASKASTGNIVIERELCDINILLTQTLGEFEEKLSQKGLEFVINKPEESIYIMADNRHIWRIFDNLMNNIYKYGQPGTRVYINLESKNNEAIIIFRNTSNYQLNISSDELLERFVRGDSSRHTEGSGLGLSIAQNLAELMGGSLKLYVDGDLFKVVLSFPRTDAPK